MRGIPLSAAAMLALTPIAAHAQEQSIERDRALAAVDSFMAGFNAKNAAAMTAMTIDGAMVTVVQEMAGDDRVRMVPLQGLIGSITSSPSDLREPVWDMRVMQDGPVATVVADFEFLIDGQRSHCGTNIFNLIRVDGEWKIASIAYSHIEEGCLAAPEQ